jgi:hypothetical protein
MQLDQTATKDQSWLLNDKGLRPNSCTLRIAAFTASTHYPKGYLPSGLELGMYTSGAHTGLFAPFTPAASDGTQVLAGYLFTSQRVRDTTADIIASILEGGQPTIVTSKLPIATQLNAAAQAASVRFIYQAA